MPSKKDRLYVALYVRGGPPRMPGLEDTFHWALLTGPKSEKEDSEGKLFHVRENVMRVWQYESVDTGTARMQQLLVRIVVAKIMNMDRLERILGKVPLRPEVEGWNCVEWVREALLATIQDKKALGTSAKDWQSVRDATMEYIEGKRAARRFTTEEAIKYGNGVPTWDMLNGVELHP